MNIDNILKPSNQFNILAARNTSRKLTVERPVAHRLLDTSTHRPMSWTKRLLTIDVTQHTCVLMTDVTRHTCVLMTNGTQYTCVLMTNVTQYTCVLMMDVTRHTCAPDEDQERNVGKHRLSQMKWLYQL